MIGIQIVSARIGGVTGDGLAANIRKHYSPWLLYGLIVLLLVPGGSIAPAVTIWFLWSRLLRHSWVSRQGDTIGVVGSR